ncbi:pH-response regulator protein palA/rim20 [Borealophlyctis nickersoniae]|nr:pH-response regulator protein palA/rim20 [Borealophlyctis nickersoniae]
MEVVPRVETLSAIGSANMVKAQLLPELSSMGDIVGPPMFASLVPFSVHQAASIYSEKKDSLVTSLIARIQEGLTVCHSTLASLNLPAAIEALEQPIGLPPALLQRSQDVRKQGGANSLRDQWQTVLSMAERDAALLEEAIKILDDEAREDDELRTQFRERWTRAPSRALTSNMRDSVKVYQSKLDAAKKSNELVRNKIDANMHLIESLSLTKDELEASIPSSTTSSTLALKDPNVKQLKVLLDNLNQNMKKCGSIVEDLKKMSASDDIGPRLIEVTSRREDYNNDELFNEQLKKYDPFQTTATEMRAQQEKLVGAIREANSRFLESKQTNEMIRQREQALQNLDNAYKAFMEISGNISEGIKFYTDFQNVLSNFKNSCSDFAFARGIDKKDYLTQIQQQITNTRLPDAPQLPPRSAFPPPGKI